MEKKALYSLSAFTLSFCVNMSAQTIKGVENDSIITWDKSRQLVWDDFKDAVDWNDPIGNAMTSYKIVVVPENVLVDEEIIFKITRNYRLWQTLLLPFLEWINVPENLLRHEQTHFDIGNSSLKLKKALWNIKEPGKEAFSVYYSEFKELLGALQGNAKIRSRDPAWQWFSGKWYLERG